MTNKEAIRILVMLQEPEPWEPQITEKAYDALGMAIEALKKQIPKKPVETSAWKKEPRIKGSQRGCLHNPVYDVAPMDMLIAVGFGDARVTRDGTTVYNEPTEYDDGLIWTVQDAEDVAVQDPDHDWRIVLYAPLYGRTFQRQDGEWVLISENMGFV